MLITMSLRRTKHQLVVESCRPPGATTRHHTTLSSGDFS